MPLDLEAVRRRKEAAKARSVEYARMRAHDAFDVIWREGYMTRSQAYEWLAGEFGRIEVHMKTMTIEECRQVEEFVKRLFARLGPQPVEYGREAGAPRDAREAREAFRKIRRAQADPGDVDNEEADRWSEDWPLFHE
jgi:hypothetical protein